MALNRRIINELRRKARSYRRMTHVYHMQNKTGSPETISHLTRIFDVVTSAKAKAERRYNQ